MKVDDGDTTRKTLYWSLSGIATLTYLLICCALMMVPGVESVTKLVLLSFVAFLLAIPLAIGIWNFTGSEAPIMIRPLGPVVGVVVLLQLLNALVQIGFLVRLVLRGR